MKTDYDAIIIGGAVGGATAAILLAQAGWSVALVEKHVFPRRKVCGECIAASNLPLLDALGIGDAFAASAGPSLERVGLYAGNRVLFADLPPFDDPAHAWGRALGREHLDTLLLRRAAALGASIWQPWTVSDVSRYEAGHICRVVAAGSGECATLRAPILIAAHGSWERGPAAEDDVRPPSRASDLFAFKASFTRSGLAPGLLPVLAFPGGYGGMVMADRGTMTLACCIRRDRLQLWRARMPGARAGAAVQAYLEETCLGVRQALRGARREDRWLSVGPIRPGIRSPWNEQRGFAVGNAAGEAHPILGEGISMAIQSAWLLCERLIPHREQRLAGRAQAMPGRDYASSWRQSFAPRIRAAAVFSHLAMRPSAAAALLPLLQRWPRILTTSARLGGKVRRVVEA